MHQIKQIEINQEDIRSNEVRTLFAPVILQYSGNGETRIRRLFRHLLGFGCLCVVVVVFAPIVNALLFDGQNRLAVRKFRATADSIQLVGMSKSDIINAFGKPAREIVASDGTCIGLVYQPAPWYCFWKTECGFRLQSNKVISAFFDSD